MRPNRLSVGSILSLGIVLALRTAAGQDPSGRIDAVDLERKAESALDRIQRNDVGQGIVDATYDIELAAHVEPDRTIPVLEAYFARSREPDLRNEIASVLVSLGDKNPVFRNLILAQARSALSEDSPDPFEMGKAGKASLPCSSEAFVDWARKRGLGLEEACKDASFEIPQRLRPLADSGDRDGIPVLQTALKARNPLLRGLAAQGLVLTGDGDAITSVIEAIDHAPQDEARGFAECLLESDDPRAESVVHQYMPDIDFREAHKFRAERAQLRRPILTRN